MSRFNLAKKFLPAKKAWKSFKASFLSKLQKLKTSKTVKTSKKYCIQTLNSIRVFIPCKLHALIRPSLSRSRQQFYHYHQHKSSPSAIYVDELFPRQHDTMHASHHSSLAQPYHASHHGSLAQPSQANEMVVPSSSSGANTKIEESTRNTVVQVQRQHHQVTSPGVKILEKNKGLPRQGGETSTSSATSRATDAWKLPLLPQLRCVDERAEEFISKFRQEMKIEREQSIIDFQEMLARST
ncbi:hypothetical protein ACH5RR_031519 [Cinchona calisaya]|uniref:DUF761 domain-containing protein n=1 Tax=Cinchona calisaya TaxID=153742 RepID=A0ABD2YII5_9GENT